MGDLKRTAAKDVAANLANAVRAELLRRAHVMTSGVEPFERLPETRRKGINIEVASFNEMPPDQQRESCLGLLAYEVEKGFNACAARATEVTDAIFTAMCRINELAFLDHEAATNATNAMDTFHYIVMRDRKNPLSEANYICNGLWELLEAALNVVKADDPASVIEELRSPIFSLTRERDTQDVMQTVPAQMEHIVSLAKNLQQLLSEMKHE